MVIHTILEVNSRLLLNHRDQIISFPLIAMCFSTHCKVNLLVLVSTLLELNYLLLLELVIRKSLKTDLQAFADKLRGVNCCLLFLKDFGKMPFDSSVLCAAIKLKYVCISHYSSIHQFFLHWSFQHHPLLLLTKYFFLKFLFSNLRNYNHFIYLFHLLK